MALLLKNPLEILEILEVILEHVSATSDLKNARLVAKIWKKAALKQWRGLAVISLVPNQMSDLQSTLMTISQYVDVLDDDDIHTGLELNKRPFQQYKLKNWIFTGDTDEEAQLQERIGPVVKYLRLDNCKFLEYSVFDDFLTRSLPCLKKLVWSNVEFLEKPEINEGTRMLLNRLHRDHSQRTNFQRSVRVLQVTSDFNGLLRVDSGNTIKLLYSMPNVKELIIRTQKNDLNDDQHSCPKNPEIISLLCAIRTAFPLHSDNRAVRELDIMDFFSDARMDFSQDQHFDFPVERLSIDVGALTFAMEAEFMLSSRVLVNSLKVLKAFRAPLTSPYYTVPFMNEMKVLEELYLWGTFTTNLEFLRNTPNLKRLVLKSDCYDKRHKFNAILSSDAQELRNTSPVPRYLFRWPNDLVRSTLERIKLRKGNLPGEGLTVTTLHHLDIDYEFNPESIPHLAKWLPNVTTLKMVLDNGLLDAVSTAWPNLRELECLFGSTVDDDGIASLLRFKNLKKFKSNAYCNRGLISSSSVDRVFLKMKDLKDLHICVSSKMSQPAVEELERKIWRVRVVRNYSCVVYGKKHSHECCDRLKFLRKSTPPSYSINFIEETS